MIKSFAQLSDSYKIALAIAVFFLLNSAVSSSISAFPAFAAYIVGFSVGLVSAFIGFTLNQRRRVFAANDIQIEMALDLCKQLTVLPSTVLKKTPSEVFHLICASKAYFSEGLSPDLKPSPVDVIVPESWPVLQK